jgi:hypothetical protein
MKTRKPLALRSFRLPYPDVETWQAASRELEISQSEFLRQALREKARQVLEPNNDPREEARTG